MISKEDANTNLSLDMPQDESDSEKDEVSGGTEAGNEGEQEAEDETEDESLDKEADAKKDQESEDSIELEEELPFLVQPYEMLGVEISADEYYDDEECNMEHTQTFGGTIDPAPRYLRMTEEHLPTLNYLEFKPNHCMEVDVKSIKEITKKVQENVVEHLSLLDQDNLDADESLEFFRRLHNLQKSLETNLSVKSLFVQFGGNENNNAHLMKFVVEVLKSNTSIHSLYLDQIPDQKFPSFSKALTSSKSLKHLSIAAESHFCDVSFGEALKLNTSLVSFEFQPISCDCDEDSPITKLKSVIKGFSQNKSIQTFSVILDNLDRTIIEEVAKFIKENTILKNLVLKSFRGVYPSSVILGNFYDLCTALKSNNTITSLSIYFKSDHNEDYILMLKGIQNVMKHNTNITELTMTFNCFIKSQTIQFKKNQHPLILEIKKSVETNLKNAKKTRIKAIVDGLLKRDSNASSFKTLTSSEIFDQNLLKLLFEFSGIAMEDPLRQLPDKENEVYELPPLEIPEQPASKSEDLASHTSHPLSLDTIDAMPLALIPRSSETKRKSNPNSNPVPDGSSDLIPFLRTPNLINLALGKRRLYGYQIKEAQSGI